MKARLADPSEEMSPVEKAALLREHVATGVDVASVDKNGFWVRKDFSGADLSYADLSNTLLRGANLSGCNFRDAVMDGANLSCTDLRGASFWGASLNGTSLKNAQLSDAQLSGCELMKADLSGAFAVRTQFNGAHLVGANLQWANIDGADFMEAYLWGANLSGAEGIPGDRRGVHVNAMTYTRSQWTPAHLSEWLKAGALVKDFESFPPDTRAQVSGESEGLSLRFKTHLTENDRFVIGGVVLAFREQHPHSTVRVTEYRELTEMSQLHLRAADPADLVMIAIAIYQRIWEFEDASPIKHDGYALKPQDAERLILAGESW